MPATDLKEGSVFEERYLIGAALGSGAFGSVFAAYDQTMKRDVAIKLLNVVHAGEWTNDKHQRFIREGQALSQLQHKNIVQVHRLGMLPDGRPFMVMDLVGGETLRELIDTTRPAADPDPEHSLRSGPFTVSSAAEIAIHIAEALAHAHAAGIVHRDIKPDNIILTREVSGALTPHLVDFGLGTFIDGSDKFRITQTGQMLGTPDYMSPEQCRGQPVDGRSDIYALGCVLFEMITGSTPFASDSPMTTIANHVSKPIPKLNKLDATRRLPPLLQDTLERMLAKDPDNRYQSCAELLEDLHGLAQLSSQLHFSSTKLATITASEPAKEKIPIAWVMAGAAMFVFVGGLVLFNVVGRPATTPGSDSGKLMPATESLERILSKVQTHRENSNPGRVDLSPQDAAEMQQAIDALTHTDLTPAESEQLFRTLARHHKDVNILPRKFFNVLRELDAVAFTNAKIPLNNYYAVGEAMQAYQESLRLHARDASDQPFDSLMASAVDICDRAHMGYDRANLHRAQAYRLIYQKRLPEARKQIEAAKRTPGWDAGYRDRDQKEYDELEKLLGAK